MHIMSMVEYDLPRGEWRDTESPVDAALRLKFILVNSMTGAVDVALDRLPDDTLKKIATTVALRRRVTTTPVRQ